jgi:predicted TIM-barrel fold metal-dependent hydrolase
MMRQEPQKEKVQKQEPQKTQKQKPELLQETMPETVELTQKQVEKSRLRKTTDAWDKNLELYRQGAKSGGLNVWKSKNRKEYKTGVLAKDKYEKLIAIGFPFDIEISKKEKVELIPIQTKEPSKRKTSEKWESNLEQYLKGEKSYAIYNWITSNRKQHQAETLSEEKYERLKGINFRFEGKGKKLEKTQNNRKRGDEWELNFASYLNDEKGDIISSWIANNRKEFKTGKLTEARYEKLVGINFPFDVGQKKDDNWEKLFEEWKNGDRKSVKIQQWRQRSIRQHSEDKLSVDKILKLKEAGILK